MAKVVIDNRGAKRYYDDKNDFHRDNNPAVIHPSGAKEWYTNGDLLRLLSVDGSVHSFSPEAYMTRPSGDKRHYGKDGRSTWPEL